ncbi:MAG: anhydro-N-acetylmuramic acid kinase [Phormidium sp.]
MTKVIGLISGTSVDGIDAALVEISGTELDLKIELLAGKTYPYPPVLREKILAVCAGAAISMAELAELDDTIGQLFAQAAQNIQTDHPKAELIGSHGQTVYHRPPNQPKSNTSLGYSLQLGRGEVIAQLTGINTINNFRLADIACGGQGAPLVPRVDAFLLSHPTEHRCIQNIGGIGNVTYLPPRNQENWLQSVYGWDTGPGNALLDLAVQYFTAGSKTYDKNGDWAASGTPCFPLVERWLKHPFFQETPPKSTGRELFGVDYLQNCLADIKEYELTSGDFLATLTELTVASIVQSYHNFLPKMPDKVLICGGGSRNLYLKKRLETNLNLNLETTIPVLATDEVGLSADSKEAIAFAVLAYWRNQQIPGNLTQVTGAQKEVTLGNIHIVTNGLRASIESCKSRSEQS